MDRQALREFSMSNGELVAPLPYCFENGHFFNFYALGNMSRMQKLCDAWFNKPSGFAVEVEPAAPFVVITFVYYPKAWSAQLPISENGFMSYREMIFSIFVKTKKRPWQTKSEVYGFIPYLLLDRARAIVAGREAFGLPKAYGKISFPDGSDPDHNYFSCRTVAPRKYRDFFSQAKEEEIFRIKCPGNFRMQDYMTRESAGMEALLDHSYQRLNKAAGSSMDMSRMVMQVNQINSLTMFQLRDPHSRRKALHQSILKYASENVTLAIGGAINEEFELEFPTHTAFFPIRETLGLGKQVSMAFWFRMNFEFNLAGEMWNSNSPRRWGLRDR